MGLKDKSDDELDEERALHEERARTSRMSAPVSQQKISEIDAEKRRRKNESAASGKTRLTTDDKRL